MPINSRIKQVLKQAKVSQMKLAEHLGITDSAVNQKLNDSKDIDSLEFLRAVSELTRIPIYNLISDEADALTIAEDGLHKYVTKSKSELSIIDTLQALVDSQKETITLQRAEIQRLNDERAGKPSGKNT